MEGIAQVGDALQGQKDTGLGLGVRWGVRRTVMWGRGGRQALVRVGDALQWRGLGQRWVGVRMG